MFIKSNGMCWLDYKESDGLDVYIKKIGYIYDVFNTDKNLLLHLHKDDLLYFIMNFKEEKQEMINFINDYLKLKE